MPSGMSSDKCSICREILSLGPSSAVPEDFGHALHQEILLSYRLIFGQTRNSRRLARPILTRLKKGSDELEFDELLQTLCCKSSGKWLRALPDHLWPVSCRHNSGYLQEQHTYSAHDDFPVLGHRLMLLQDYNLRQQPSRIRDLWRDRRVPQQWYTFWAVLIIGGVSILLSTLQLVVSAGQLAYTIRPAR